MQLPMCPLYDVTCGDKCQAKSFQYDEIILHFSVHCSYKSLLASVSSITSFCFYSQYPTKIGDVKITHVRDLSGSGYDSAQLDKKPVGHCYV